MNTETKNPKLVMELQKRTNFGVKACKEALETANWDMNKAMNELCKRSGKMPIEGHFIQEGAFGIYEDDKCFAVIQLGSQTDFVAKSPAFIEVAHQIAEAYAKNPEIMTKEFKEGIINTDFRMQLQPFREVIMIGQAYLFDKTDGSVFHMVHNRGRNNVFAAVQVTSHDAELGEELVTQIMYSEPLCITKEEITPQMREVAGDREVALLEQEMYDSSNVKVKDYIEKFTEKGQVPQVKKILRIQMK